MAVTGYSRAQIWLHWLVFLLVVEQFLLHDGMVTSYRTKIDSGVSNFTAMTVLHIAGGLLILAFAVWRLMLRRTRGAPPSPAEDSDFQKLAARIVVVVLYALLILLPVTGLWAWAGPSQTGGRVHSLLRIGLFFVVVIHLAGALYGQFIQKTGIIRRMMKAAG